MAESVIRLSVINDASPKLRVVDRDAKKLSNTVKNSNGALNNQSKSLKAAALGWLGVGKGAKAATPAIVGAGAAMNTALSFLLPLVAAGTALQKVFGTIADLDFAETKYETLGGNAENLTSKLRELTNVLQGQHSVVELTAASYDVASAGFIKAADAADVLKAASLGSTGGFSDLNTTGNALTSVLNAYGLEAKEATRIMDQFIQTQNDGKIIVAEYADNIGKVASVASTLNIPLAEVNAIIAQTTSAGVKSEVAFTGLKTSMLKLVSTEGQKKLEKFGVTINASTIEAEGLAANLEKLSGLGTQALTDIFGAEAIQVMAPILKDMEKFKKLVDQQNKSQGVSSNAAIKASDTLQGQLKRLGNAFINIFAEGTVLGDALKITIQGIAGTIEAFGAGLKLIVMILKGGWSVITGFAKSIGLIKENAEGALGPMRSLTQWWFKNIANMEKTQRQLIKSGQETGQRLANVWNVLQHKVSKSTDIMKEKWVDFYSKHLAGSTGKLKEIGDKLAKALGGALMKMLEGIKKLWDGFVESIKSTLQWLLNLPGIRQIAGFTKDQFEELQNAWNKDVSTTGNTNNEKNGKNGNNNTEKNLKRWLELTKMLDQEFKKVGETITQSLASGIKGLIKGTQTLGEMLSNIAMKIQDMMLDIAIKSAFKFLGFPAFAAGGRPPVGKPAIVGEKGPELFVPRQAGTIIPNHELGGGGGVSVSVNVDASGSSVEGDTNQAAQLGNMLGQAIQAELVRQKRPGGLLAA